MSKIRETDIGAPVAAWLEETGWTVYPEVECWGSVADIVALRGPLVWVVECKTSLSLDVMRQAAEWRGLAHYRSIAVPFPTRSSNRNSGFTSQVLGAFGIGKFLVRPNAESLRYAEAVEHRFAPRLDRAVKSDRLRNAVSDRHREECVPGQVSAKGARITAFSNTCRNARNFVSDNPGCSMKELIDGIAHHYASDASARSAMSQWIRNGVVDGLEARRDGRRLRVYVVERRAA